MPDLQRDELYYIIENSFQPMPSLFSSILFIIKTKN